MTRRQAVTHVRVTTYNIARRLLGNHGVHYSRQRVSKENRETFCGSVNGRSRRTIFNLKNSSINLSLLVTQIFSYQKAYRAVYLAYV